MASSANSSDFLKRRRYGSWTIYGIVIALTIVACVVAVVLRLFTVHDLPFQTFAALIGVIITAIITGVLLKGQSDTEREQREQSEVFKEKLSTYNNFLTALRNYVNQNTATNKKDLIFHTMAIRMHAGPETVRQFTDKVTEILKTTGDENENKEVASLVSTLSDISRLFHQELYGLKDDADLSATLKLFQDAISGSSEVPTEEQKQQQEMADKEEDAAKATADIPAWDAEIKDLAAKGWSYKTGNDSFTLTSATSPVIIIVRRKDGKYVVEAEDKDNNAFSQRLKDNYGGARRYGKWWRELPISNYGVKQNTLLDELPVNARARASVIKWLTKLTESITN